MSLSLYKNKNIEQIVDIIYKICTGINQDCNTAQYLQH